MQIQFNEKEENKLLDETEELKFLENLQKDQTADLNLLIKIADDDYKQAVENETLIQNCP